MLQKRSGKICRPGGQVIFTLMHFASSNAWLGDRKAENRVTPPLQTDLIRLEAAQTTWSTIRFSFSQPPPLEFHPFAAGRGVCGARAGQVIEYPLLAYGRIIIGLQQMIQGDPSFSGSKSLRSSSDE